LDDERLDLDTTKLGGIPIVNATSREYFSNKRATSSTGFSSGAWTVSACLGRV
jgi:hypothetical protein